MKNPIILIFLISGCTSISKNKYYKRSREMTPVSSNFVGSWAVTLECEKPKSWKDTLVIKTDPKIKGLLLIKRNSKFTAFNRGSEWYGSDPTPAYNGEIYRVTTDVQSFNKGNALVTASIWKMEDENYISLKGNGLAVITTRYILFENKLIFEKYGYTSDEDRGPLTIKTYQSYFPKNYRCVYKRQNG